MVSVFTQFQPSQPWTLALAIAAAALATAQGAVQIAIIKSPKNLLEILRTVDYDGKRILANNYHLQEHNRLLINYLLLETSNSDYPLLEHLFQKKNLRSYNDVDYPSEKIKEFKQFLKSYN